jgi:hypothetical protein
LSYLTPRLQLYVAQAASWWAKWVGLIIGPGFSVVGLVLLTVWIADRIKYRNAELV